MTALLALALCILKIPQPNSTKEEKRALLDSINSVTRVTRAPRNLEAMLKALPTQLSVPTSKSLIPCISLTCETWITLMIGLVVPAKRYIGNPLTRNWSAEKKEACDIINCRPAHRHHWLLYSKPTRRKTAYPALGLHCGNIRQRKRFVHRYSELSSECSCMTECTKGLACVRLYES